MIPIDLWVLLAAGWKAADSMMLLRWMVKVLRDGGLQPGQGERPKISLLNCGGSREPVFRALHDGACALLQFFSCIHRNKLWLDRQQAQHVAAAMDLFTSAYSYLAGFCFGQSICCFHLEPSLHMCKHIQLRLQESLDAGAPRLLSPAAVLCEASEDFIGKVSRISRRVHARTCGQRTLQRYMVKVHLEWEKLGV